MEHGSTSAPLLEATGLVKRIPLRSGVRQRRLATVHAVEGVGVRVERGGTAVLLGGTGCGKSTVALMLLQLTEPSAGSIRFRGRELTSMPRRELRRIRPSMQLLLQDPRASLNPRLTVDEAVAEPLRIQPRPTGGARGVGECLELVDLGPRIGGRLPSELSDLECRLVGIARALAPEPDLIVMDEGLSALRPDERALVADLLVKLQAKLGLAYVHTSRDPPTAGMLGGHVSVMHLGRVVEEGPVDVVLAEPLHPYTSALVSPSTSQPGGDVPSPVDPPLGCTYRWSCERAEPVCAQEVPLLRQVAAGRRVACHVV